jgi:hypothetical protein
MDGAFKNGQIRQKWPWLSPVMFPEFAPLSAPAIKQEGIKNENY